MDDPVLPDGVARSALLDLYFNQVVQPVLPMLVSPQEASLHT